MPVQTESPSLGEVLRVAIEARLYDLHTCMPGQVVAYDPTKQQADVQPLIQRKYKDNTLATLPVIPGVPVQFPRGGGAFISFPLRKNDYVLLIFAERSLERWLNLGGVVDPMDSRRHDLSDAVAVPGLYPFSKPLTNAHGTDLVVGLEDGSAEFHFVPGGDVYLKGGNINLGGQTLTSFVALAEKVLTELGKIQTAFNSHTHPYVDTPVGPAVTSVPAVPMSTPSSVASSKVKVTT